MSTTLVIAKRELRSYFDSPIAYIVICLSLAALGLTFFFMWGGGFWQQDRASLASLYQLIPRGLSLVIVPVLTMRLLSEEKRSGTLEMLITLPVRDHEVILGKFLGALGLVLTLVFVTALYPLVMFRYPWHLGALDTGPIFTGYVGLVLYSAAAISIGLLISALTENQIVAFVVTWVVLVILSWIGQLSATPMLAPYTLARNVLSFISFDARLDMFSRGMINTRDVVFFLSITVLCLMAAFRALERRKWA